MPLIQTCPLESSKQISLKTSIQKLKPIKASRGMLAIHRYSLNHLRSKPKIKLHSLQSPFDLFHQKTSLPSLPKFSLAKPTTLIDNISSIGKVEKNLNPLQGFISSLSEPKSDTKSQFSAEIISVFNENKEFKTLRIARPKGWEFFPGQYLEIRSENSAANKPAILAIASGISDDYIELTAKPNANPSHPNHCLNSVPGEYLTIIGPMGSHFPVELITPATPVLILGGGSGLTALKSLMDSLPEGADSKLIYTSKTVDGLIYQEQIEKWKEKGHTISLTQEESEGFETGRIAEHLKNYDIKPGTLVFLCGPQNLVLETAEFLAQMGVNRESIFGSLPATAKDGGPVYRGDHPKMIMAHMA